MQPTTNGTFYLYSNLLNSSGTGIVNNYAFNNTYHNTSAGTNQFRLHTGSSFSYMPLSFEGQKGGTNGYSQSFVLTVFDPLRNVDANYINFVSNGVTNTDSGFGVYYSDIRGFWYGDTSTAMHGLEFFYSGGADLTGQISLYGQKK